MYQGRKKNGDSRLLCRHSFSDCRQRKFDCRDISTVFYFAGNPPGVQYRVEEREVKARMDTPAVRAVLDMGFDRNLVLNAIRKQLHNSGKSPNSATCVYVRMKQKKKKNSLSEWGACEQFLTCGRIFSSLPLAKFAQTLHYRTYEIS